MKISELNTKSFLGASGAAENSYVLINYEDETTNEPVTYKATVQELGKTIANKLGLAVKGSFGINTVENSNGTWVSRTAGDIVTQAEKNKITAAATQSQMAAAIETATSGLASTGYVTNAVSGLASIGYITTAVANAGGAIDPSAPVELIDENQLSGVQETYPLFIGGGSTRTFYEGSESGQATPIATIGGDRVVVYNSGTEGIGYYDPGDSYFNEITIGGTGGVSAGYVANAIDGLASQGYVTSHAGPSMGDIAAEVYNSLTTLHGYVADIATTKAAAAVNGLASTGDVTAAVNGLASTGYVTAHAGPSMGDIAVAVHGSGTTLNGYIKAIASTKAALAVNGLASTGAVTAAVSGLASTGAITGAINNYKISVGTVAVNNSKLKYNSSTGISSYVTTDMISGAASTGYVTSAITTATSGLASTGALSSVKYAGGKIFKYGDDYVIKSHADASDPMNLTTAVLETECSIGHTQYFPIGAYIDPTDHDATLYRYNPTAKEMQALQLDENNISNAISGLASTGYVTSAIANAGGGTNFIPEEYIDENSAKLVFITTAGSIGTYNTEEGTFNTVIDTTNQLLPMMSGSDYTLAYVGSSDNRHAIYTANESFMGFLSPT